MGALLSTNAGREHTSYVLALSGTGDLAQGVDIVSDFVTGPAIGKFETEKAALLRNLELQDQTPRKVIEDRLHITAFRDDSLGFSTIGPFDGIESLTTAHLQSYIDTNYTAEKIVLAAAGPVSHEQLVQLATKSLGGVRTGTPVFSEKPYFSGAELLYRNDEMGPTAYLSMGWEGVSRRSPDAVTLMLCQALIGSYKKNQGLVPGKISGNRTINSIANKMDVGCADEFEAFNISYKDTGIFGWYAQCDEVAVDHCVHELMMGVNWLSHTVTDEEVERAKRDLQRALFGGSGSSSEACSKIGEQVLAYGRGISTAEMVLRINAIDAEEIKRVAWERFADAEIAVTGLGPLHGMPPLLNLRRATNLHRY
jgi:processing peptidase subunit beta